jgi:hypothetical protein
MPSIKNALQDFNIIDRNITLIVIFWAILHFQNDLFFIIVNTYFLCRLFSEKILAVWFWSLLHHDNNTRAVGDDE